MDKSEIPNSNSQLSVEFWERHYQDGTTAWDLGAPAPPFIDLLAGQSLSGPGSMIVLGSGRGHDALLFARHGFQVTALDFAESAVRETQEAARRAGLAVETAQHDFFALPPEYDSSFDYVLEHTFFVAIDPGRRAEYVRIVRGLLKPTGLFIALFYAHGRPGGPPFTTSAGEVRSLFEPHFRIERLEVPVRSVKPRQGLELLALMRPK
jgi:SAM-dependent methyltransferase